MPKVHKDTEPNNTINHPNLTDAHQNFSNNKNSIIHIIFQCAWKIKNDKLILGKEINFNKFKAIKMM